EPCTLQGEQSSPSETARCRGPKTCTEGEVGPKTATVGTPSARAACTKPVSPPTLNADLDKIASASPTGLPVVSMLPQFTSRAISRSRGPPSRTGRNPRETRTRTSEATRDAGQILVSHSEPRHTAAN